MIISWKGILIDNILDSWPVKQILKRSFLILAQFQKWEYNYVISRPDLAIFISSASADPNMIVKIKKIKLPESLEMICSLKCNRNHGIEPDNKFILDPCCFVILTIMQKQIKYKIYEVKFNYELIILICSYFLPFHEWGWVPLC